MKRPREGKTLTRGGAVEVLSRRRPDEDERHLDEVDEALQLEETA